MPTDTIRTILGRRSVRSFQQKPVVEKDLKVILEAGRNAPSAANRQPWHVVVVREEAQKKRLAAACANQMWIAEAGVVLAGIGKPEVNEKWYAVDTAICLENMILAATSLGYGTCWIGAFDQNLVREVLGIPDDLTVIALTPVGVPADEPAARPRMSLSEFASAEKYGEGLRDG